MLLARSIKTDIKVKEIKYYISTIRVFKISFNVYYQRIHGYLITPNSKNNNAINCVIYFHGTRSNRGYPHQFLPYTNIGMAVLAIDIRGQGGETLDDRSYGDEEENFNLIKNNNRLKGILNINEYYLRRIIIDSIKCIDFIEECEIVKQNKIIVTGASLGGALSLYLAGLDERVSLAMPDVPSGCDLQDRIKNETGNYACISEYIRVFPNKKENVIENQTYFDLVNFADRIKCEVYASVSYDDDKCPIKNFFAMYNRINSRKRVHIYSGAKHGGGRARHAEKKFKYLKNRFNELDTINTLKGGE